MEREWTITRAENLHGREQRLAGKFYEENPTFPKMLAFKANPTGEYEGVIYGFIAGVNEFAEDQDNESLWVPVGVMSNGGDFVLQYSPVR